MIATKCKQCGKDIQRTKWEFNRSNNHFCSKECRYEHQRSNSSGSNNANWKGGLLKVKCSNCGKDLLRKQCQINKSDISFCSKECRGSWLSNNLKGRNHPIYNSVEYKCDYCGKHFMLNKKRASDGRKHFCNRKCTGLYHQENYTGEKHWLYKGTTPFIKAVRLCREYYDWRTACFERDNYTCVCGQVGRKLVVHHKIPLIKIVKDKGLEDIEQARNCPELWDIDNGITLCVDCHKKEHKTLKEIN